MLPQFRNEQASPNLHLSIWSRSWPHKIGFFLWLMYHKRLATMDTLYKKGKPIVNGCLLCCKDSETVEHHLFNCSFSFQIWKHFKDMVHFIGPLPYCIDLIIKGWRSHLLHPIGYSCLHLLIHFGKKKLMTEMQISRGY